MCRDNCMKEFLEDDGYEEPQYIEPEIQNTQSGPPEILVHIVLFIGGTLELIHLLRQ